MQNWCLEIQLVELWALVMMRLLMDYGLGIGPLLDDNTTGNANKSFVKRDSGATQGDVINASSITLFSTSDASFNFTLNSQYLDGSSTNSSAAMSAAVSADFGTDTATLQT